MNIPVFIVTLRLKETSEATKITMISLAVTDLMFAILSILKLSIFAFEGLADDLVCTIDGFTRLFLSGVSTTTMTYLCIDRVITIKYPLRYPIYFTRKTVTFIHLGIWLVMGLICIWNHFVSGMEMAQMKKDLFCRSEPKYRSTVTLMSVILGFIVPACSIFACAFILLKIVRKQIVEVRALEAAAPSPQAPSLVAHIRAIKTIFCMVAGYYVFWSPIMLLLAWTYFYGNTYHPTTAIVLVRLAMFNSMINPLVYLPTMREYRTIFKQIFIPKILTSEVVPN